MLVKARPACSGSRADTAMSSARCSWLAHSWPRLARAQPSVLSAALSTSASPSDPAMSSARAASPIAAALSPSSIRWPARFA